MQLITYELSVDQIIKVLLIFFLGIYAKVIIIE